MSDPQTTLRKHVCGIFRRGKAIGVQASGLAFAVRCQSCGHMSPLERCEIDAIDAWNGGAYANR